ncbi:fimbrial protein [Aeromonas hydrophila]|uniref:fimbrial protein n=1 Tax=Aeromonas hydrophila TaxID=644 RepID=UPI001F533AA2|nr:hypothetical protein [Aeromonas hydrophila]UUT59985.1 hypothetical protein MOO40_00315 [Aeromonas hydrophila]
MKRWLLPVWLLHACTVSAGEALTVNISANVVGNSCYIVGGKALHVNLELTPIGILDKTSKGIEVTSPNYVVHCDGGGAEPVLKVGKPEHGQRLSHITADGFVLKNASTPEMASGVGVFSWLHFGGKKVRVLEDQEAKLTLAAAETGAGFESKFHFTARLQRTGSIGGPADTLSAGLVQVSVPLVLSYQ